MANKRTVRKPRRPVKGKWVKPRELVVPGNRKIPMVLGIDPAEYAYLKQCERYARYWMAQEDDHGE